MNIREYELEEAWEWYDKAKNSRNNIKTIPELLAEYGRRLYNQAINDACGTVENQNPWVSNEKIIERIKKLKR